MKKTVIFRDPDNLVSNDHKDCMKIELQWMLTGNLQNKNIADLLLDVQRFVDDSIWRNLQAVDGFVSEVKANASPCGKHIIINIG